MTRGRLGLQRGVGLCCALAPQRGADAANAARSMSTQFAGFNMDGTKESRVGRQFQVRALLHPLIDARSTSVDALVFEKYCMRHIVHSSAAAVRRAQALCARIR